LRSCPRPASQHLDRNVLDSHVLAAGIERSHAARLSDGGLGRAVLERAARSALATAAVAPHHCIAVADNCFRGRVVVHGRSPVVMGGLYAFIFALSTDIRHYSRVAIEPTPGAVIMAPMTMPLISIWAAWLYCT